MRRIDAGVVPQRARRVGEVDRVAAEAQTVALPPEPDLTGRVPRQVHNLEAANPFTLCQGAGDLNRTAIPDRKDCSIEPTRVADRDVSQSLVAHAAVAFGVGDLVPVAENRDAELR